jgi:hypothetical protein
MLDLGASIEPGRSAAGLSIGESVAGVPEIAESMPKPLGNGLVRFDLGPVSLWVTDGVISQIAVRQGYTGRILGTTIGLGSSLQEVQDRFGVVTEDDEDNLVVAQMPGLCFETQTWRGTPKVVERNCDAKLTGIFIFAVAGQQAGEAEAGRRSARLTRPEAE